MCMDSDQWTIGELAAQVAAALDDGGYAGAPNGRVRDVPDARAIRWYATIGLVDRPMAMRGRVALYGRRHLLQLVAVKRLQAAGLTIAEIQRELTGAPDRVLIDIAAIPEEAPEASRARSRFWATPGLTSSDSVASDVTVTGLLAGVPLGGGAVLLLPGTPDPADVAEILAAARPLLDLLVARDLVDRRTPLDPYTPTDELPTVRSRS